MSAANDNYPPILTRPQAAALCQLTPSGFDSWVRRGVVPGPIRGTKRWSRDAILRAVDGDRHVDVELDPFEQWEADRARKVKGA